MRGVKKWVGVVGAAGALCLGSVQAKTLTLGYVAAGMQFPFNVSVVKGFSEEAKKAGVNVIVLDGKANVETQGNAIDDLIAQKVDGIAVLPIDGMVGKSWADRVAAHGVPFVSVATEIGDPQKRPIRDVYPKVDPSVKTDFSRV